MTKWEATFLVREDGVQASVNQYDELSVEELQELSNELGDLKQVIDDLIEDDIQ